MELLVKADGKYRTAPDAACLSEDAPDSILPMLLHAAALWDRWTALTRRVGGTPLSERRGGRDPRVHRGDARRVRPPGGAAREGRRARGRAPAPRRRRRAGDLHGRVLARGAGALGDALRPPARRRDRPPAARAAGLLGRVTLVAGDFETDELPGGHDLAWLSAIVHQNGPAQNDALYARILRALAPGGRLVIRDHLMEPDRTRPRAGALFAVNMLVGTAHGGTYTFEEIRSGLERAGSERTDYPREGERMDGLVEAFRP